MNKFGAGLMCRDGGGGVDSCHGFLLLISRVWTSGDDGRGMFLIFLMIKICLHPGVEKSELEARSGESAEDGGESKSKFTPWCNFLVVTSVLWVEMFVCFFSLPQVVLACFEC